MQYSDADVFVYQIMDCLVSEYDYKIVNVPGSRRDIWLANEKNDIYPMIRLTPIPTTSSMFEKEYLQKIKKALTTLIQSERPLIIMNTNAQSSDYVEDDVIQVIVNNQTISNDNVIETFPKLPSVIKNVENNQEECARLMRHMESQQLQKVKEANRFKWKEAPKMSSLLVVISVIVFFVGSFIINQDSSQWIASMVASGGYYKAMIIYGHEYWRIFTSIFVHYDLFTLLFYGISMYQLGKVIEKSFSKIKYLILFFGSALIGNVLVLVFSGNNVSFGMGGGLFGILAAFVLYVWDNELYRNPVTRMQISQIIVITLLALFFSGSSPYAFAGGFVGGLFLTIMLSNSKRFLPLQKHFYLCGSMCIVFLGYSVMTTTTAYPQFKELDEAIVKEYKQLGLENYSKHVDNYLKEAYKEK